MSRKRRHQRRVGDRAPSAQSTGVVYPARVNPSLSPGITHPSALERFGFGIPILLLALLVSTAMHRTHLLDRLENFHLDFLFSLQRKQVSESIAIVWITEDDYQNKTLFGGVSPLNSQKIRDLIRATARSGARLIVVDLDTSSWTSDDRESAASAARAGSSPRLVWARTGWFENSDFHPDPLRGKTAESCEAVPAVIPDQSHTIRRYRTFVYEEPSHTLVPGMPVVVHRLANDTSLSCAPENLEKADRDRLIDFAGGGMNFAHATAEEVLADADSPAWRNFNPLKNKIVFIGGAFREARDSHVTPLGEKPGVDLMADSVVSVSQGITAMDDLVVLCMDFVFGLAVLVITCYFPAAWVWPSLTFGYPLSLIIASVISYGAKRYFISIVPVVAALVLERLFEHRLRHTWIRSGIGRALSAIVSPMLKRVKHWGRIK